MIRRGVIDGLLVGLVLVLVLLYPLFATYLYPRVLNMPWPPVSPTVGHTLLILSAVAGLLVVGLVGSLVAMHSGTTSPGKGAKMGAVSGMVAALVVHIFLLSPTFDLYTAGQVWAYLPTAQAPLPDDRSVILFIQALMRNSLAGLAGSLAAGAALGAVEGAFFGLLHRRRQPRNLSLLDVANGPNARSEWYVEADDAWSAGIGAGLLGGIVLWLGLNSYMLSQVQEAWPAVRTLVGEHGSVILRTLLSNTVTTCLSPFLVIAVFCTGGLAVLLLKDPPRRHLSRLQAVLMAGTTATVPVHLALSQAARFFAVMGRYYALESMQGLVPAPGGGLLDAAGKVVFDADTVLFLQAYIHSPALSLPMFYVMPLVLLGGLLVVALAWFAPQAAFYGLILPLVFKRPVDRAGRIARAVNGEPGSVLPRLYRLFGQDPQALRVLPHLAFLLKDTAARQVVAAYHTLASRPGQSEPAISVIRQTVAGQESWRWRAEVGELYRVLDEGLAVKTVAQIRAIKPPPQEVTSSLPLLLAKSCEGLGRILGELAKVERVDDLGTKIIFLNSAQAALLDLRRYAGAGGEACQKCATIYPEVEVLQRLLDCWQDAIIIATQDLQGRANLHAEIKVRQAAFAPKVCTCLVVSNQGLNVAEKVRVRLVDGEGYQVLDGTEQQIDILSPQETHVLEFSLAPAAPSRLRLAWELTYDDAVDTGRRVTIADMLNLDEQEQEARPFERIFPIPYVTGTPLRSGEMFVGRQDVFEFVCEHLLGRYQNNVIVLHGQRRTGKTSILYRLQQVLADTHVSVLVDMQGKAARGMADFLYALSDDIVYTLESQDPPVRVELPDRAEFEAAPEFTFRSRFLRAVIEALDREEAPPQSPPWPQTSTGGKGKNLLLMFDEFEELQDRVEDRRLEPEVFPFLRNLMQHEPRVDFIFSGTHKLEDLCAEYWSILFNTAVYKRITFLSAEDVRRLVTEPVAPYGLEYDPLAIDRIMQVTAGHPYFTQVVCHEMVAYHNETRRGYLTATCVDQALERIVERGEAHFKYIWSGATPDEQRVMLTITDLLPDADAGATPAQIGGELDRKGYCLSGDALTGALAHLQARDILARSGPQSSLYRFKIDLIRRWIGISRPAVAG